MAGGKAEKPDTKEKKSKPKKADPSAKVKKDNLKAEGIPTAAKILSLSVKLTDIPSLLYIPERACTKGSTQLLNP